jgi:hypothetical protein
MKKSTKSKPKTVSSSKEVTIPEIELICRRLAKISSDNVCAQLASIHRRETNMKNVNTDKYYVDEAERLEKDACDYRKKYKKQIKRFFQFRTRKKLAKLLATGKVVAWCRDGGVCQYATECETLKCKHKTSNTIDGIAEGMSECNHFAITAKGKTVTAIHVDWEATKPNGPLKYEIP